MEVTELMKVLKPGAVGSNVDGKLETVKTPNPK
jgi:hypothetical protein